MGYSILIRLAEWEGLFFICGLAGIIILGLLNGEINTRHLMAEKRTDGSRPISAVRVQLLIMTLAMTMQYVLTAIRTRSGEMPAIPDGMLELLGLSNAIYLGGKGLTVLRDRLTSIWEARR